MQKNGRSSSFKGGSASENYIINFECEVTSQTMNSLSAETKQGDVLLSAI